MSIFRFAIDANAPISVRLLIDCVLDSVQQGKPGIRILQIRQYPAANDGNLDGGTHNCEKINKHFKKTYKLRSVGMYFAL